MVHVLVGLVYCEIIYISCVLTKENKRNSNTKTAFQRFIANTWTTTWSLNSVFKRSGADLVTTMTSLKSFYCNTQKTGNAKNISVKLMCFKVKTYKPAPEKTKFKKVQIVYKLVCDFWTVCLS